jgi:hypothetical protein
MKIVHDETVKFSFDEESLTNILEEYAKNNYYTVRYGSYECKNIVVERDDSGKLCAEATFVKMLRNDFVTEEEKKEVTTDEQI